MMMKKMRERMFEALKFFRKRGSSKSGKKEKSQQKFLLTLSTY